MHGGHIPDGERLQRQLRQPADRTALISLVVLAFLLLIYALT